MCIWFMLSRGRSLFLYFFCPLNTLLYNGVFIGLTFCVPADPSKNVRKTKVVKIITDEWEWENGRCVDFPQRKLSVSVTEGLEKKDHRLWSKVLRINYIKYILAHCSAVRLDLFCGVAFQRIGKYINTLMVLTSVFPFLFVRAFTHSLAYLLKLLLPWI